MDRFHENLKFFSDSRKKKMKEGNLKCHKGSTEQVNKDPRITSDVLQNSCLYCEKVFINSKYLLKHLLRRHSEKVVNLHYRCSQSDSSELKKLFTFLEEEFSVLKNEILSVKKSIGHEIVKQRTSEESNKGPMETVCPVIKTFAHSDIAIPDIPSNEVENLRNKVHDIEGKIQCLCDKLEENDKVINTAVLLKQDIHERMTLKEKILRKHEAQFVEMRQALSTDLKSVLGKQLYENNLEWKSKFTELKDDILKLDQVIAVMQKKIDSPEYLLILEKKLESQISNFLGNNRQMAVKGRFSKSKKHLSIAKRHDTFTKNQKLETDNLDGHIINSPIQDFIHLNPNQKSYVSNVTSLELNALIAEKLSFYNISPDISRLSNAEYEDKLKLINGSKNYLKEHYDNFSEIYSNINICADQRVLSKLKSKRRQKLRFSEPLILTSDISCNLKSNKTDFLNKTCPVLDDKNHYVNKDHDKISYSANEPREHTFDLPKSEEFIFPDITGSGDFSGNFHENDKNHINEIFEAASDKKFQTSSPVIEAESAGKTENSLSNSCSFIESTSSPTPNKKISYKSVEIQDTSRLTRDDYTTRDETFFKYLKTKPEMLDQISEIDDDETSLKSLSSLDDDELSFIKDAYKK